MSHCFIPRSHPFFFLSNTSVPSQPPTWFENLSPLIARPRRDNPPLRFGHAAAHLNIEFNCIQSPLLFSCTSLKRKPLHPKPGACPVFVLFYSPIFFSFLFRFYFPFPFYFPGLFVSEGPDTPRPRSIRIRVWLPHLSDPYNSHAPVVSPLYRLASRSTPGRSFSASSHRHITDFPALLFPSLRFPTPPSPPASAPTFYLAKCDIDLLLSRFHIAASNYSLALIPKGFVS